MSLTWNPNVPIADPDLAADNAAGFDSQAEAEAWLTDVFADLLADGVESVELTDGDRVLYTMGLTAAEPPRTGRLSSEQS
ncbi:MAG: hypothetical protein LBM23_05760 [Propionibacteriaceae bacterium]|jgi:hypothetical protein|nr:hypothetical protein [Propionibacteriaceae bacterium]